MSMDRTENRLQGYVKLQSDMYANEFTGSLIILVLEVLNCCYTESENEVIKEFNSYSLLRKKQVDNASFNMLHKLDSLLDYKEQVHLLCSIE